jgi:hypothetical protein
MTVQLPTRKCPVCETKLNAATAVDAADVLPETGDITVCFYCAAVLVFAPDLGFDTIDIKSLDPALQSQISAMIAHIHRNKPITIH